MLGSSDWIFWRPLFEILSRRLPQALGDALAQNNSVTSLNFAGNDLGDEGAKARLGSARKGGQGEGEEARMQEPGHELPELLQDVQTWESCSSKLGFGQGPSRVCVWAQQGQSQP